MTREIKGISNLLEIVLRRRWCIIIPAVSVFLLATLAAVVTPRKYRSSATILIEGQEVPSEYVRANISSYAEQRIQTINQQIMGAPRLRELIERLNLYDATKQRTVMEEMVERMRKDIKLTPISADVVDPRSGRPAQTTIAFAISFQGRDPDMVQRVASELCSLYLAENVQGRNKQSAGTYRFLQEEMLAIQGKLSAIDSKIARFKQKNIGALPELSQVNVQAYEQVDREIRLLNDQLRSSKEKLLYLQSQLANVQSELNSNQKESLRQLKLRLNELKSRFSDEYPDVKKTRFEIAELERQMKDPAHVVKEGEGDNPAYVTLVSQLAAVRSDTQSLRRQIAAMEGKREAYQQRITASPRVEEGYKAILLERENLQQKYDDLARKAMEARVAHGMEKEQLGERFIVVDPARRPEKPISPNVPAILLIGVILGACSGVALAALREAMDDTVRVADDLAAITDVDVLAIIPEIRPPGDSDVNRRKWFQVLFAAVVGFITAAGVLHFLVIRLDVLWAKLIGRMAS